MIMECALDPNRVKIWGIALKTPVGYSPTVVNKYYIKNKISIKRLPVAPSAHPEAAVTPKR
jgi:hypothetical protein